ncbi:hypothetical protein F4806DRAFT_49981 [Annulohypoxylon nitens]|nr:hypothetical protein F4806DRAFT_49981 [Annulohypoxylon nitens]
MLSKLPPPSPRVKMSSSETNSENSPHSTVLCATTKTKHARTVGRSVTANMIVLKSRISLPTSFAVSAATPATWPEIALIGRRVRTGEATVPHVLLDVSALETPLIANMSNSCKSSEEALADPQLASRQVLVPTAMAPRGPTGAAAPWRSRNNDQGNEGGGSAAPWRDRHRGNDNHGGDYYGGQNQNFNGGSSAPGSAPWHQASAGQQSYANYPGYSGYGAAPGMGPPPGLAPPGGSLGAPPGLPPGNINALIQQYANGAAPPPPPPPAGEAPPPPPGDQPPPPPPGA